MKIVPNVALVHLKMQNKKSKIFIIAGEVSGDVLGAHIMREMQDAEFVGIGGENMVAAGLESLFPMSDLSVMGVIEVIAHVKTLTKRIKQTVGAIIAMRPDIVLTIDSPGFAHSVINGLRKSSAGRELIANGLKFHHVVAPQVWAWRAGRAKKYARTFDKLYAFFDFEVPYFTKYGLDTVAVGHPIADVLLEYGQKKSQTDEKIITLVPGSRMSEVKRLLPIFRDVAHKLATENVDYKFVIPVVETTVQYVRDNISQWDVKPELVAADQRYDLYAKTYIAIVASGTVSAELAMLHIPTIVVYKMNPVTSWLVRQVIRVKWVSLVNILLNRGVYPEFLGADARAENVLAAAHQLTIPAVRDSMIAELRSADTVWRRPDGAPSQLIVTSVRNAIKK